MPKFKLIYQINTDIYEMWSTDFEGNWKKVDEYKAELCERKSDVIYGLPFMRVSDWIMWDIDTMIKSGYEFIGIEYNLGVNNEEQI